MRKTGVIGLVLAGLLAVVTPGDTGSLDDERAVTAAALDAYFNLIHGGTAVAFPEQRRPVLLHRTTIAPSREQLRVRVSSPANRAATLLYSEPATQDLVERLLDRSEQIQKIRVAPIAFALAEAKLGVCGPVYDAARFSDAIAVSRPAFGPRKTSLIYLESSGGAHAYHATLRDGTWKIDWYVELWACG